MTRRTLLALAGSGALVDGRHLGRAAGTSIRAAAFDAFAVFDPRPIAAHTEELFPGRGAELTNAWRTRQFEYTWLRTLTASYADFETVTEQALVFAAKMLKVELSEAHRRELMRGYAELRPWPDAAAGLEALRDAGVRLALLSNFTSAMLRRAVGNAGFEQLFEAQLSTDRVRAYKPDPRAYAMAMSHFRLRREEIVFAAFAGWDAAGAKRFGFPTFWVNRTSAPLEELDSPPDGAGTDLGDLVRFTLSQRNQH